MSANPREIVVLKGVHQDCEYLANVFCPGHRNGRELLIQKAAREGFVRPNLEEWLGRAPTSSERVLFTKVYRNLEARGLVELRLGPSGRLTHLKLTEAGNKAAESLLTPSTTTQEK